MTERAELNAGDELWGALRHHGWIEAKQGVDLAPDRSRVRSSTGVFVRDDDTLFVRALSPYTVCDVAFNDTPLTDAEELWRIVTGQDNPDRSQYAPAPPTPGETPF